MKTWITDAQQKFKEWKISEGLTGDCVMQTEYTDGAYEEKWSLYPKTGGTPEEYTLFATKGSNIVVWLGNDLLTAL